MCCSWSFIQNGSLARPAGLHPGRMHIQSMVRVGSAGGLIAQLLYELVGHFEQLAWTNKNITKVNKRLF